MIYPTMTYDDAMIFFLDTGHFVHAYRLTSLAMYGTMVP